LKISPLIWLITRSSEEIKEEIIAKFRFSFVRNAPELIFMDGHVITVQPHFLGCSCEAPPVDFADLTGSS